MNKRQTQWLGIGLRTSDVTLKVTLYSKFVDKTYLCRLFCVLNKVFTSDNYESTLCISGLRGAISYALSLHLEFSDETRHVIITTTLIIVLVTTLVFGGSTMPLMKVR